MRKENADKAAEIISFDFMRKICCFLMLIVASTSSWAINKYRISQGAIVYEMRFTNGADNADDKKDALNQLFSSLVSTSTIYFDKDASIGTSWNNQPVQLHPFKWGPELELRHNDLSSKEIWKKVNGKTYTVIQNDLYVLLSYTGKTRNIEGFFCYECNIKNGDGPLNKGWVTNGLPRTAGIELVKDCKMALVAIESPGFNITIVKIDAQIISFKEAWAARPKTHIMLDIKSFQQKIQPGTAVVGSIFPTFDITTTTGKPLNRNMLAQKTTVFFFWPSLMSTNDSIPNEFNSTAEQFLTTMQQRFDVKKVQVIALFSHMGTEVDYVFPNLKKLKSIDVVGDASSNIRKALKISLPYALVVDKNGTVIYSNVCIRTAQLETLIEKVSEVTK